MTPSDAALRVVFSTDRSLAEWSTELVALGLGIELLVVLAESRGKPFLHKFGLAAGTMVILFGVIGEWVFGGRSGDAAEELQRRSEKQVASLHMEAEKASVLAAQIEQAAAWRVISPSLAATLATKLATTSGGQIRLGYPANDPEALFLSVQFSRIFERANQIAAKRLWLVQPDPRVFSRLILFGIDIFGDDADAVASLRQIFAHAGIHAGYVPIPNIIKEGLISGFPMAQIRPLARRRGETAPTDTEFLPLPSSSAATG